MRRRTFSREFEVEAVRLVTERGVGTFVTDVNIAELAQTYRLRLELAELIGKLDPVPPSPELLEAFRAFSVRAKALLAAPDPRHFARLNMDYFLMLLRLTANEPLRAISDRLYLQTTRIWLKSVFASLIDLREEVVIFDSKTCSAPPACGTFTPPPLSSAHMSRLASSG